MRIKVAGCILTLLFGVIVAWVIAMAIGFYLDPSVVVNPASWVSRFVPSPDNVYVMIQLIGNMLWHFRGIDMVLLGVFLLAAALASSAFFYEITKESTKPEEKE
jgi:ABC-type amino acid transport system permease subunit